MANRIGFTDTLTGKETVCGKGIPKRPSPRRKELQIMSIERLPHKYPIGCTVRIGWRIGTILFRIGLYHLIIWEKKEPTF